MRVVNLRGASLINHEGTDYTGVNGVFDLPEDVANSLTGFPDWVSEYDHLRQVSAEEVASRTEPELMAEKVADLEARVAALEAKPKVGRPPRASA